ncbi:MAG: MlaD family protein [Tannerellaceae bacterium]|jgi:phospholipid/cholesterol/gamma-HCH transport system substrate-binding protein|nr:MlaD family protein [Tannerellaceae bacterium]
MMKRKFTKEAKIGIITIIGLSLLYLGINYLKGINLFKPSNQYFVSFDNVKDVTISSPVFVDGFKVGLVRSISYDYSTTDKIKVEMSLDDEMRINKGSYVVIVRSFLGGAELHIHLNKYIGDYMKSGETLEGRMGEDMIGSVQDNILPAVAGLLPKIDSILTGLQTLINHPALSESLAHIEKTTGNLEASSRQLNQLLNKDVPVIISDLKTVSHNFSGISEDLKSLDLQSTVRSVNETLANLKLTTDKFNSKDNSLGLLLNDNSLYYSLNEAVGNASGLLLDLKEHPKRYVHFSLF